MYLDREERALILSRIMGGSTDRMGEGRVREDDTERVPSEHLS